MSIHTLGVLIDNDNYGTSQLTGLRVVVSNKCFLNLSTITKLPAQTVHVQTNCTLSLNKAIFLSPTVHVQTVARVRTHIPRTTPETSKFSSYTITPAYRTHAQFAFQNLLSQFKGFTNIEKLIETTLEELDQCQTDVYNFQDLILNLEKAEGVNLDICGAILGRERLVAEGDIVYRNSLFAQIFINICDGTIPKILSALTIQYNLEPGPAARPELQVSTLSNNRMEVYVRDVSRVLTAGGAELIDYITPAGAVAEIVCNDRFVGNFGYFAFTSVEGGIVGGLGWGSYYDETIGGALCGLINPERFTGDGEDDGAPLLVTNKTIPVPTFDNTSTSFGPDRVNRRPDFAKIV